MPSIYLFNTPFPTTKLLKAEKKTFCLISSLLSRMTDWFYFMRQSNAILVYMKMADLKLEDLKKWPTKEGGMKKPDMKMADLSC